MYVSRGSVTVAREAHNLEVVGPIPTPATKKSKYSTIYLVASLRASRESKMAPWAIFVSHAMNYVIIHFAWPRKIVSSAK